MSDPDERVDLERLSDVAALLEDHRGGGPPGPGATGLGHGSKCCRFHAAANTIDIAASEIARLRDRKLLWEEVEEADNRHLEKMEQQRYDLRTANARLRAECKAGREYVGFLEEMTDWMSAAPAFDNEAKKGWAKFRAAWDAARAAYEKARETSHNG